MAATPHPADRHSAPPVTSTDRKSGKATASMILGILSLPALLFWPVSVVLALVGLTLGFIARGEAKRGMEGGGMAMAGIVCSGIALAIVVILFAVGVAVGISD
jgi:hypothetical protein